MSLWIAVISLSWLSQVLPGGPKSGAEQLESVLCRRAGHAGTVRVLNMQICENTTLASAVSRTQELPHYK